MHTQYDSKGKVKKSAEEMRREFDRHLESQIRVDGRPDWWTDDDDATASTFAAARAMGLKVPATGTGR
jgi:hypothetical protein